MYSTSAKNEVVIKLVGKLSMEFEGIDQLKVRSIVEEVLYKYSILPEETGLVASDIEEKLQIYLASKKLDGLSIGTLKNYRYNLIIFADYLRKPLAAIETMDLRMFLAARCKDMKQSSVNGQISILKSFFGWLADEEYIPKNPAKKLKQTKQPKRVRKPLTEFLISTGCRLDEVFKVNKDNINWHEMSLFVVGKGDKERKVYFNTKAKILLKKYLFSREDDDPALFVTSKRPYHRLGKRSIQREFKKIANIAGIEKSIHPHLFRHSFATYKINSGMSLPVLQHLMGHENPSTT
ncbi:integrase, partial [Clostridium botulinum]|nr:integrase [Clostridium botulinum]